MHAEPLRGADGQMVEGIAQGFPDTRSAIDGTRARQCMPRVRAPASAGIEPRAFAAAVQDGIEQALFGGPRDQTGTKLAEDRAVEAGVSEL